MKQIKPLVFLPPFLLCAAFVVLQLTNEAEFIKTLTDAFNAVAGTWGWLVSLLAFAMMVLCGIIYASSFGRTVLGGPGAKKLLSTWQMFAVVLTTNIATGILFWGVYEPAWHLSHPPGGVVANSPEAAQFAISTVYLHWTFTPYAFGSIVGLMFAFAYYNMKRPFSLGAPLAPLLGRHGDGKVGQVIDAVCLYCLVAGLTSALAGSALLMGGGIHQLFHIPGNPSNLLLGGIIAAIMGTSVVAAISGITKGIRWIANANTVFLIGFLALVLVLGPTRFILDLAVEGLGQFLGTYFQKVLNTGAAHEDAWPHGWTQMYFSAFFAWAPIMGVFLGRIAYGYTVRAFLFFNVFLPSVFTGIWMAVICGAVVHMDMIKHLGLAEQLDGNDPSKVLYAFLGHLPFGQFLVPILLITAFLSFVTTADGNTDTMSNISSKGISPEHTESSMGVKIAWGTLMAVFCYIILTSFKKLDGIKMLANLGGFPALFLCLGISICALMVVAAPARYDKFDPNHVPDPADKSAEPKV
jgi:choline-glycine betaine transporter